MIFGAGMALVILSIVQLMLAPALYNRHIIQKSSVDTIMVISLLSLMGGCVTMFASFLWWAVGVLP